MKILTNKEFDNLRVIAECLRFVSTDMSITNESEAVISDDPYRMRERHMWQKHVKQSYERMHEILSPWDCKLMKAIKNRLSR